MIISKPVLREFPYRQNPLQMALLFVLALAGTVVLGYFALYADKGANLKGIELTRTQFRLLMGAFAVLSPLGLIGLGWGFVRSLTSKGRVAFTHDSIILPKPSRLGLSEDEIELPFDEIRAVQVVPFIRKTKVLQIITETGYLSLLETMFRNRRDFTTIGKFLATIARRDHD
jgi:hypothetical protein